MGCGWGREVVLACGPCSENSFPILGKKEEGLMPARGLLRPGEEERKTEIETEQEGGEWIWADRVVGSKDRGTRESQARITQWPSHTYLSQSSRLLSTEGFPHTRHCAHKPSLMHE